jgi:hypothetical protein
MSFQAYIDNIKSKTGKTPEDFKKQLDKEGILKPNMKATELVTWLKENYELGQGHSMAIWAYFKSKGWVNDQKKKN